MQIPVELSPKFWILNTIFLLLGVVCLLTLPVLGVLCFRRRGQSDSLLAPFIMLAMMFLFFSGGFAYFFNQASRTASFRATPNGVSWTNWKRPHAYSWREVNALILKRGTKGWDILEIRCRENAVHFDILEIDSTDVREFQALVKNLEKATHLQARRSD